MRLRVAGWLMLCWCGLAQSFELETDKDPRPLAVDEAYVAIEILHNIPFRHIRLDVPGLGTTRLEPPPQDGASVRLYRAKTGWHRPDRVELGYSGMSSYFLRVPEAMAFEVKPGTINYPGSFQLNIIGLDRYDFQLTNRMGAVYGSLLEQHPQILQRYSLQFLGTPRDDFVEFAKREMAKHAKVDTDPARKEAKEQTPDPPKRGIDAELLYDSDGIVSMRLSPDGRLIAEHSMDEGLRVLAIIEVANGRYTEAWRGNARLSRIEWAGADRLVIEVNNGVDLARQAVIQIETSEQAPPTFRTMAVPVSGTLLVDALPHDPDHIALTRFTGVDTQDLKLFRVNIADAEISPAQFQVRRRIDFGLPAAIPVLLDRAGVPLVAVQHDDEEGTRHIMFRKDVDAEWQRLLSHTPDQDFRPVAIDGKAGTLDALSNLDRPQIELVRYELASGKVLATVYGKAGIDLDSAIRDGGDDRVVGVRYHENARLRVHYFDASMTGAQAALARLFPSENVMLLEQSVDAQHALVFVSGATNPGRYYLYSRSAKSLEPVGDESPRLADLVFAKPQRFTVASRDGLEIEAFITLTDADKPRPLVVMPHGGPIGVRDTLSFDPDLQYLVARGYAVLQVNFRGSGGFGKAFEQAGYRNWGQKIEDDIEAALDYALENYPVDRDRVCAMGISYGGYSSLMALIRAPQRFRCGVSLMGPTDLPLMFSSSDFRRQPDSIAIMKRIAGDPVHELESLQSISPVYRYAEIQDPVLLIHGRLDQRVSIDHAERLRMLLESAGREVESLWLDNEAHGFRYVKSRVAAMEKVAAFLEQHLPP